MVKFIRLLLSAGLLSISLNIHAEEAQSYLTRFFSGYAFQFGYGSGTSSNNPRVELVIHYCASGYFYSSGQSCRPNIIAKGYQCTNIQDAGQWQMAEENGQGYIQWMSNISGPGSLAIYVRTDGSVVDAQGNPFQRVGSAQCG